jgi:hypothetical protein
MKKIIIKLAGFLTAIILLQNCKKVTNDVILESNIR